MASALRDVRRDAHRTRRVDARQDVARARARRRREPHDQERREDRHMTLREKVAAWQEQEKKCQAAFDAAKAGIKRELEPVGGYATTSPDSQGYCGTFWWHAKEDLWSTGATE